MAIHRLQDPTDPKPLEARESDLEDATLAALEIWSLGKAVHQ